MFEFLVGIQQTIREALSVSIASFAETGNWTALLYVLPMGIIFGTAHAMTPGHSKSVLAAYIASTDLKPLKALVPALVLSLTHITSAVLLALITNALVTRTVVGAGRAPVLESISRWTLVAIGLWLVIRSFRTASHPHAEGPAVGFVAGLVPCPLTLFIMVLAISRGVPEAGLMFALAMLIGVGLVLATVAAVTALARGWFVSLLGRHGKGLAFTAQALECSAGVLLIAIAARELMN